MPEFKDIGKASKDLFAKPFNAGKFNIDLTCGAFTLKNSQAKGAFSSTLERKDSDVFAGMLKGTTQPCKTIMNGKSIKTEISRVLSDGSSKVTADVNSDTCIESGATAYTLKAKVASDCGLICGVETTVANLADLKYHATYPFNNIVFGVAGKTSKLAEPSFAIQTAGGVSLLTDMKKYTLYMHNAVGKDLAVACSAEWAVGSADAAFGLAAKRTMANGANVHLKTDLTGKVDIAHVSSISEGVKLTMSTSFNAQALGAEAPTWGAGLEFAL